MGCDIHMHFEIKVNGEWHHYGPARFSKNYAVFARMANVRNSTGVEPISKPRGLPDDCTFSTKLDSDHWGVDGHSHSYLSSKEFIDLCEWAQSLAFVQSSLFAEIGDLYGNSWEGFYEYREDYPKFVEDYRVVFWFDN